VAAFGVALAAFGLSSARRLGLRRFRRIVQDAANRGVDEAAALSPVPELGVDLPLPGASIGRIEINSLGFRSPEIPMPKPRGLVRLVFLGSSSVYDSEVGGNEACWTHLTWRRIQEAWPTARVDYVNAGVPGISTQALMSYLLRRVAQVDPDVAIIQISDLVFDTADLATRQGLYEGVPYSPSWLARRWNLWAKLEKNAVVVQRQRAVHATRGKLSFDPQQLSRGFEQRLEELVELVRERSSIVVLMTTGSRVNRQQSRKEQRRAAVTSAFYMPYLSIDGLLDGQEEYDRVVVAVAGRTGSLFTDGHGGIPTDDEHYADSNHFADAGSRKLAERVAEALLGMPALGALLDRSQAGAAP